MCVCVCGVCVCVLAVEILRITPLDGYDWKMDVSYQNHWKKKSAMPLNVGHRGMGSSYKRYAVFGTCVACSQNCFLWSHSYFRCHMTDV